MIPIELKKGVSLRDFKPQCVVAMMVSVGIYEQLGAKKFVITSGNDSNHMKGSKHYEGYAFDCRVWVLKEEYRKLAAERIAEALGAEYDVLFKTTHIHIEYDPD